MKKLFSFAKSGNGYVYLLKARATHDEVPPSFFLISWSWNSDIILKKKNSKDANSFEFFYFIFFEFFPTHLS